MEKLTDLIKELHPSTLCDFFELSDDTLRYVLKLRRQKKLKRVQAHVKFGPEWRMDSEKISMEEMMDTIGIDADWNEVAKKLMKGTIKEDYLTRLYNFLEHDEDVRPFIEETGT